MRRHYLALGVLMLWSGWVMPAAAQSPVLGPPAGAQPALSPEPIATTILGPITPTYANNQAWTTDVVVGFPTGIRAQHTLGDGVGRDWLVEGIVGIELIYPMIGVGIRRRFRPVCGEHDAFSINPGVNAYLLYNVWRRTEWYYRPDPRTIELPTVDVDFLWEHAFNDRCAGYLGLKVGAGVAYGNHWGSIPVPVVGFILGCRF